MASAPVLATALVVSAVQMGAVACVAFAVRAKPASMASAHVCPTVMGATVARMDAGEAAETAVVRCQPATRAFAPPPAR